MNSKQRFSNRVDTYVKYRPSYPKEALDYLFGEVGFGPGSVVADVGAGTGIFSALLLERGAHVIAVEPNEAMRAEAVGRLAAQGGDRFEAASGSAEATGLPDASVDGITCAQSFHWFDREATRAEFRRILKPGGRAALIWNNRVTTGTAFLEEYEQLLLGLGTDYAKVNHRNVTREHLEAFFRDGNVREARFAISQRFDFDGLSGRLRSSSYSPAPDTAGFAPMMKALRELFDRNEQGGTVSMDYVTEVYWGEV
ncbi:class I SAM-dependent methyltransferase [Cohnella fermenti]|uniref:class I SAM-dependent methyltransferase n=1 Tax=Cohnella fermenti TaxID=2565925 RepID=UPI0026951F7B